LVITTTAEVAMRSLSGAKSVRCSAANIPITPTEGGELRAGDNGPAAAVSAQRYLEKTFGSRSSERSGCRPRGS
jgi:hypothetical protein